MTELWSWSFLWNAMPQFLQGLWVTVQATLGGISVALVLGLFLAIARRSRNPIVSRPVAFVVEFVRSTPLLVQLFFLFYALPTFGVSLGTFQTGVVALGVHYGAYTSEVYRAGINGVERGQWEASTALNLSAPTTWGSVVLPQAIPRVLPALGNYLIAMFKEVPLLSAITITEVLRQAQIFCSSAHCFDSYTMVGVLFLAVSIPSSIMVRRLEGRLGRARA